MLGDDRSGRALRVGLALAERRRGLGWSGRGRLAQAVQTPSCIRGGQGGDLLSAIVYLKFARREE